MSKELKALESVKDSLTPDGKIFEYTKEYKEIYKALKRLEEIESIKTSKAIECLERINTEYSTIEIEDYEICYSVIKKALIKAQALEKENKV